jgi:ATP-binding cassette subfamily C (CFTR/MRP) protein 4
VVVNPWVLISLPFLAVSFLYLRRYYMTTARVVKRLESTSRSPIYSIMNECLQGLPVIRAFGMEHLLWKQFSDASDANLRAYFAFLATSRWIGIRLDFVCLVLLIVTAFACVAARDLASPALIGLILSQIINLAGAFQWTVRQSAEVENQMVSVERLLEYTELPIEEIDLKEPKPSSLPSAWPAAGAISFNNVWMKYRPDLPHVLRGVTLEIAAGTKIGVVGRTGAGKSSLLLALLRLVEPERRPEAPATASNATISVVTAGQAICGISIDGVDIASVSLSSLRRAISTIPQDPVLYSGTIRSNLDPFNTHTDAQCVQALERVQLTPFLKQVGGLGYEIAEGGSNLSVGQRQLICLSRALLRNSRVILMDEATANVDADTDAAIQFAVRHAFKDATVITIAHRLGTVIDADGVLVMDQGVAAEFGPPHILLQNAHGAFSSLVDETGPRVSAKLRADAQAAYASTPVQVHL